MKNNTGQLEDTVILSLVDCHDAGMDFSDACVSSQVPPALEHEAKEFWYTLSTQLAFSDSLYPKKNIIDEVFLRTEVFRTGEILRPASPSPYMKYVMAFAAPAALAVLVIGVAFRTTDQSASPLVAIQDLSAGVKTESVIPEENVQPLSRSMPVAAKMASPMALTAETTQSAPVAAAAFGVSETANKDPKQLFAMLQGAGVQEAQSDTQVDDMYDAKLSELDAKVIDQNANINSYVSLQ